jgi:Domain of unknown function DUF29
VIAKGADVRTLYDEDFVAWTEQQPEALRAAARGGINPLLDCENLAEAIESLGRSDRRELHNQIYRVIEHLAKLQFSPASDRGAASARRSSMRCYQDSARRPLVIVARSTVEDRHERVHRRVGAHEIRQA